MPKLNLFDRLTTRLDAATVALLRHAGESASARGDAAYLVGGVVRDLVLERSISDIDIVVDGDAFAVVDSLSELEVRLEARSQFLTYKSTWQGQVIDIATARRERYRHPGALPVVEPGPIAEDLRRRDFTINALALSLSPSDFGDVLDVCGGLDDLGQRQIRILHDGSFEDDATRLWRAVRYETRLEFQLSADTESAARRDARFLETISPDRLRHELDRVWQEREPERAMVRASELGLTQAVVPPIPWDDGLSAAFRAARTDREPDIALHLAYVALLGGRLDINAANRLVARLNLPREEANALAGASRLRDDLGSMDGADSPPSAIVATLDGFSAASIQAHGLLADSPRVRERLLRYLREWRYVQPSLRGDDLIEMGIAQGPRIGEMLRALRVARLDDGISPEEERRLVRDWTESGRIPD